jgi:acetyl-CoA carboxylase carboxyltransferase component
MNKREILRQKKKRIIEGNGPDVQKRVFYDRGMLPPRNRIKRLLDPGSFHELGMLVTHHCKDFGMEKREILAEGVITGSGQINGRTVCVYAQDFSALGGTYGEMHGRKICNLMDLAAEVGVPVIGICHSGGLRLQEILAPMEMFGHLFYRNSIYSGVIPQISIILGTVAGGQAYSPGLTDFILMTKGSTIFIAGPPFVKTQTGQDISSEELGGAEMHARTSGVVDVLCDSEEEIFSQARRLVDYLPLNFRDTPPRGLNDDDPNRCETKLNEIVPSNSSKPFDMHGIIEAVFDNGEFFETKPLYAGNIITGFGRLAGYSVGIVANQPAHMGGVIDVEAAEKAARFVRFCDAFNLPIISFQDSPGYLIGVREEKKGMIYKGAKLLYAYAEATVPKITVIVRKAYAGAYIALGSRYIGADLVYAWPGAEIASVAPDTAASVIFRKEIQAAEDKGKLEKEIYREYHDKFINPYNAASWGHIDDVIEPKETRPVLIQSFFLLKDKKQEKPEKKHGNIPL